jgi:hypothetical protein
MNGLMDWLMDMWVLAADITVQVPQTKHACLLCFKKLVSVFGGGVGISELNLWVMS